MTGNADAARVTQDYYDSADADTFYERIWGGEDIHIGIYESEREPIRAASRRTVERMAELVADLPPDTRVLDLGSGYGGAARFLAEGRGFQVDCLNISERQNRRNRRLNAERGLEGRVRVTDGDFENVPFPDARFDLVWSQDAILHSANKDRVFAEIARVLRPGGTLLFTDPMQSDECPDGVLTPILERIHLRALGSPGLYRELASGVRLDEVAFADYSPHLPTHYRRVGEELGRRGADLAGEVSGEYVERMLRGLGHWVQGGAAGHLCWGIFRFRKAAGPD